jgi:hypothetical protein
MSTFSSDLITLDDNISNTIDTMEKTGSANPVQIQKLKLARICIFEALKMELNLTKTEKDDGAK